MRWWNEASWWFVAYIALAWSIRVAMVPVILRRQLAPGASLAWLGIIFLHPYIGGTLYAFLGETRLGPHRVERHREIVEVFRRAAREAAGTPEELDLPLRYEPMVRQAERISGMPVLGGNSVEFIDSAKGFVKRLVADIDGAKSCVHLLYYILACDGFGTPVMEALKRAARRGVTCRLLVDAVASRPLLQRVGMVEELEAAGVKVAAALPAHFVQRRLPRMDLRNHRKLSVIDDEVAYVGSHNLINPDYGGKRGGPWVDVTGRVTGAVVAELAGVFAEDWAFETEQVLEVKAAGGADAGRDGVPMQVVPTGPVQAGATYRRVLLAAVQSAQVRLTLTTPYFVPDEPTLVSLMMAADRGVDVRLVVPAVSDNRLTQAAGRAHYQRLMEAGVRIYLYGPGLVHTKSVTVDDALAVFGSANLDVRSFNLNFELSVLMYGREAVDGLRAIQERYVADAQLLDPAEWARRAAVRRYVDSAISLLSPLL